MSRNKDIEDILDLWGWGKWHDENQIYGSLYYKPPGWVKEVQASQITKMDKRKPPVYPCSDEHAQIVDRCFRMLFSQLSKDVLYLYYIKDKSIEDCARGMGVNKASAQKQREAALSEMLGLYNGVCQVGVAV